MRMVQSRHWPPAAAGLKNRIGRSAGERARMRSHFSVSDLDSAEDINYKWGSDIFCCKTQRYIRILFTSVWMYLEVYPCEKRYVLQKLWHTWHTLYMYIYIHTCTYTYVHTHTYTYIRTYSGKHPWIYTYLLWVSTTMWPTVDFQIMRKKRSPLATSWFLKIGGLQNFGFRPTGCCTITFLGPQIYAMDCAKGCWLSLGIFPDFHLPKSIH